MLLEAPSLRNGLLCTPHLCPLLSGGGGEKRYHRDNLTLKKINSLKVHYFWDVLPRTKKLLPSIIRGVRRLLHYMWYPPDYRKSPTSEV